MNKEEWKQLVTKELKGSQYESLIRQVSSMIEIEPYYTKEEINNKASKYPIGAQCLVGASYQLLSVAADKALLMDDLNGGVNSPAFHVNATLGREDANLLLKDVDLNYVTSIWHFDDTDQYLNWHEILNWNTADTNPDAWISIVADPVFLIKSDNLQLNKIKAVKLPDLNLTKATQAELVLADWAVEVDQLLQSCEPKHQLIFAESAWTNVSLSNAFLDNVAFLKAIQLVWGNILLGHGLTQIPLLSINGSVNPDALVENPNYNIIRCTAIALSMRIAGVARIELPRFGSKQENFDRRIARNIIHLFEMESYLDKFADHTSGSYYWDSLVEKIAEAAWNKASEKVAG